MRRYLSDDVVIGVRRPASGRGSSRVVPVCQMITSRAPPLHTTTAFRISTGSSSPGWYRLLDPPDHVVGVVTGDNEAVEVGTLEVHHDCGAASVDGCEVDDP